MKQPTISLLDFLNWAINKDVLVKIRIKDGEPLSVIINKVMWDDMNDVVFYKYNGERRSTPLLDITEITFT